MAPHEQFAGQRNIAGSLGNKNHLDTQASVVQPQSGMACTPCSKTSPAASNP